MSDRRFQFDLRMLLLLMLIAGPLAGWGSNEWASYREALQMRKKSQQINADYIRFSVPKRMVQSMGDWPNEGAPQGLSPSEQE